MEFVLEVRARLICAADDEVRFSRAFTRSGPGPTFFVSWAREDGRAFRDERDRAVRALGREIAEALLAITAILFERGLLDATSQTVCWSVIFFFVSAAASRIFFGCRSTQGQLGSPYKPVYQCVASLYAPG